MVSFDASGTAGWPSLPTRQVASMIPAAHQTGRRWRWASSGAVAQLGEHHVRNVGVVGSNPICSTNRHPTAGRLESSSHDSW